MTSARLFALLLLSACVQASSASDSWWALQPLHPGTPPAVNPARNPANPVDAYVHHHLTRQGLTPAPPADPATRLRRLYQDLLGLPPSPEETAAFLQDDRPDAWERQVDALLASPRHGEHWATSWLDLVRYSESDGWNQDAYRPHLWRYRDYVVQAFNADLPYAQFVRQQVAGDELPADSPQNLEAAGFLRLGIYEYNQRDARSHWNDILNEITDTAGDVFFGLSMACARCHDHKFDDISQKDYFRLRAFFEPLVWRDDLSATTTAEREAHQRQLGRWEEATRPIRQEIDALIQPYHDRKWESTVDKFPLDIQACFHKPEDERNSWEQQMAYLVSRQFMEEAGGPLKNMSQDDTKRLAALEAELEAFAHLKPAQLPPVMTVSNHSGTHAPTLIPDSGDPPVRVEAGFLGAMARAHDPRVEPAAPRSALAEWITRPENPLTTRVYVNRIWQGHFGRGLVDTPNDFGRKGSSPSHPHLLDWLTDRFLEGNWQVKPLHRLIVTSATWQQSSLHPQATQQEARDPEELWLWRAPLRRLPGEAIRDAMLTLSGEAMGTIGGPSVDEDVPRRGLYVKRFRNDNDTLMHAFDMAPGLKSVAQRNCTTTPTQSLTLINGSYTLERARAWARRLLERFPEDAQALAAAALHGAWGRPPTPEESARAHAFLQDPASSLPQQAEDLCHVLFNSNEFLYLR